MSDKLEELQARMKAVWAEVDEEVAERRVVNLHTRKPHEPGETDADEISGHPDQANKGLIQMLEELLSEAKEGRICAMLASIQTAEKDFSMTLAIDANSDLPARRQLHEHIAGLEHAKMVLLSMVSMDDDIDDEEEFEE